MGTEKLIDKMQGLLKLDREHQKKKRDKVHGLLKKLKKKQKDLEDKLRRKSAVCNRTSRLSMPRERRGSNCVSHSRSDVSRIINVNEL